MVATTVFFNNTLITQWMLLAISDLTLALLHLQILLCLWRDSWRLRDNFVPHLRIWDMTSFQFAEIKRWRFVRQYGPQRLNPSVARMTILPIFPVSRAPTERDVQNKQNSKKDSADGHCDIECREVAVLESVCLYVRIFQVFVALV